MSSYFRNYCENVTVLTFSLAHQLPSQLFAIFHQMADTHHEALFELHSPSCDSGRGGLTAPDGLMIGSLDLMLSQLRSPFFLNSQPPLQGGEEPSITSAEEEEKCHLNVFGFF